MSTKKIAFLAVVSIVLLAVLFAACSSKPTVGRSKADLQWSFEQRWPETMSIVEYRKIAEEGDGKIYTIRFKAKVRFLKDTVGCVTT